MNSECWKKPYRESVTIIREARESLSRKKAVVPEQSRNRPLALFTESTESLLTSRHDVAFTDLVSLMRHSLPHLRFTSTPRALSRGQVPVLTNEGAHRDAVRVLGVRRYAYTRVRPGPGAVLVPG